MAATEQLIEKVVQRINIEYGGAGPDVFDTDELGSHLEAKMIKPNTLLIYYGSNGIPIIFTRTDEPGKKWIGCHGTLKQYLELASF
jgi:hypothetical protein